MGGGGGGGLRKTSHLTIRCTQERRGGGTKFCWGDGASKADPGIFEILCFLQQ